MLRETESVSHGADWCEMTMSVLREKQFEACERRLSSYPRVSLFSPEATEADAQNLLECSFLYGEEREPELASLQTLRERVLQRLPVEALYLPQAERDLLEQLLVSGGVVVSTDWDAIGAAEALASRLWCSFVAEDDSEEWRLELPRALQEPLLNAYHNPQYVITRERMLRFDATIHGLLYIAGFLHSSQPEGFFTSEVMERSDELARSIAMRYLKSTFEYMETEEGSLMLVHPGLADPYRLLRGLSDEGLITLELTQEMVAGGMNGIFPEEVPLHEAMRGALDGALRPECDADEAAEDLRILAKQGVSLEEMEDVMATMLCVLPTPLMKQSLRLLYESTPHWIGLKAGLQH